MQRAARQKVRKVRISGLVTGCRVAKSTLMLALMELGPPAFRPTNPSGARRAPLRPDSTNPAGSKAQSCPALRDSSAVRFFKVKSRRVQEHLCAAKLTTEIKDRCLHRPPELVIRNCQRGLPPFAALKGAATNERCQYISNPQ